MPGFFIDKICKKCCAQPAPLAMAGNITKATISVIASLMLETKSHL